MLMQSLWQQNIEWDEPLQGDTISEWFNIKEDVTKATATKFPSCYFPETPSTDKILHIFSDASMRAYCACSYLVSGHHSTLVMTKNRVAPLKQMTIPKLELCAAVLGARLCNHITTTCSIQCQRVYLWSDSQITPKWISTQKKLNVFVSNRVREIKELTISHQWRYCHTDTNPADLLSRGISYKRFHDNQLWFNGPAWLKDEALFPVSNLTSSISETYSEESDENEPTSVLLNRTTFSPAIITC